jgi:hypothetical protein
MVKKDEKNAVETQNVETQDFASLPIVLLKPHTHAGQEYQPGETIAVAPDQAQWLHDLQVAEIKP